MRNILTFIFFAYSLALFSQSKKVVLDWGDTSAQAFKGNELAANPLHYNSFDNTYVAQWEDNGFANPTSLKVSNLVLENISKNQLSDINEAAIPSEVSIELISSDARELIYTMVSLPAIINQNGIYKRVISFDVNYTYSSQPKSLNRALINSVLATGDWYKFKVENTGVFKVDRNFLNSLGMNVNNIDPRKLKIYGNGGQMLPYLNNLTPSYDLVENAIQVVGEEDGSFDSGDYILFYGIANEYNSDSDTHNNVYDDNAYYFITADGENGKRIQNYVEPSGNASTTINQFNDYQFYEKDEMNPALVGRRWYSNRFDMTNIQTFDFNFPQIVLGQTVNIRAIVVSISEVQTYMDFSVNGQNLMSMTMTAIDGDGHDLATIKIQEGNFAATSENMSIEMSYDNSGNPAGNAFVEYIAINALRHLTGVGTQLPFRYDAAANLSGVGEYIISNASEFSQVWDVTNPAFITSKINENNASTFTLKATMGEVRNYIAVNPANYYLPTKVSDSRVANQNLKGSVFLSEQGVFEDIDYLIITSPFLLQPALRLANHRKNINGLRVKVVTTDKIYNEFSTGKQDIAAIRNFVKYVYDNASSSTNSVRYVCLFGDTSVDYKDRLTGNNNIVPSFHLRDSGGTLSSINTYFSDDFFGMMGENEGAMVSSDRLDIAIGRIVTDNVSQANDMVNKLINYNLEPSYGNWRNNFVILSDDVDKESDIQLQFRIDELGDMVAQNKRFINLIKIHSDSYQQETTAGGNRYPKVNEAIENAVDVGALVFNYFGHGGEDGLASEFIVTRNTVQNFRNRNKYPFFITITCEFSRFDNPLRPTAGEYSFWNREGGFIGLITTTRKLSISLGVEFNQALAPRLFGFNADNYRTPAEVLRLTKNEIGEVNVRAISFIGDPAFQLAFAKKEIRLTTLNGEPLTKLSDTLKALSKVRLGGEVVDENGILQTDYNGILEAKVFDKNLQRKTLGNDGITQGGQLVIMDFETLGEGIFNGQATITNGLFEFEFVVPRDISMPVGNGRVSLYAKRDGVLQDNAGASQMIRVGGLNENAPEDNIGPQIKLYMNDESFVNGGITNNSPLLIAKIEDENGINTASGIGHDITAILDGDEANPFILNDYYQAEVDDYTKGSLNYRLKDLEEGLHTLTLKAWDVYNNSSTAEIQFVVVGSDKIKIERVLNYPNPFVNYTEFWFNHNRPFEPLEVQVQVFTVTGKVVWTRNQIVTTDGFLSRDITWDGKDDFGDKIGKGVYVYKLTVKSTLTNKKAEKFEKLVIL